jgi:CheY-like chemotaxis protein/anti-sigma regulatory factor (Ser/Thr protein kinase)
MYMNKKIKILAVDDEEFNLDIITEYLVEAGFEVIGARDGVIAIEKLQQNPDVDVIVLDRMMPNMDGMAVLKSINENELWRNIPVIMQTAAASSKQIQEGIEAGVYYYLAKPYNESLFLSIVRAALKDSVGHREMHDQVHKQRRTLGLMDKGRFRFRTLEETNNLSYFIANCFPEPEHMVYGLNELMVNAVEHGNLGITYNEKTELSLSGQWQAEIERRLALPEYKNKYAILEYTADENQITVSIRDQGQGFEWQNYLELSPKRATDPNGRGIAIAKMKSFPTLEYKGCGNEVVCKVVRKS